MPSRDVRRGRVTSFRPADPIAGGRALLARGEWADARRAFQSIVVRDPASAEGFEGLGLAAWWLDQADTVFSARERAYQLYRDRKDRTGAARMAVWLAWDSGAFRGEAAIANGWLRRAHRLLDGVPDCPERAWLNLREGIFALHSDGRPDLALEHADEAIRISTAVDAPDFELTGRALRGFALVVGGQVADGMRELDEVNAVVLVGEMTDPVAFGLTCCYLVAACESVRDGDRAVQWCARLKRFASTWGLHPLRAVCRTQYASVCGWGGAWSEAERELPAASDELEATRPAMTGEASARLGELRRRQGRLAEAASLFERAGHHPIAQLGSIALALDRENPRRAVDLAERYLRQIAPANKSDRALALDWLVRAQAVVGDVRSARASLTTFEALVTVLDTRPLQAALHFNRGLIAAADGDHDAARRHLEDAVDGFETSGAPFETALARLSLARTLADLGQPQAALEEVVRARRALATMDAALEIRHAEQLQAQLSGPVDNNQANMKSGGLSKREIEIVRLIASGLSNTRIASRLSISDHTVHRHVANVLTKLDVSSRSAAVARAAKLGLI